MNNFGKILWKLFCATMVFFLDARYNNTFADETISNSTTESVPDPKLTNYFVDSSGSYNYLQTITICGAGYYLKACGPTVLGTKWLKGMNKTKGLESGQKITTPDYSSKDSDEDWSNFRSFIAGESFQYKLNSGTDADGTTLTADSSDFKPYRDQILSNFCTNTKGNIEWSLYDTNGIVCARCPNNANVQASTVQSDYDTGKILKDSWNIHTIADCYMQEFSDETGTYVYLTDAHAQNALYLASETGDNCYYSKSVLGTSLYYR